MELNIKERLQGCLVAGAIGDCLGNKYESRENIKIIDFDFNWRISDDTQLTLATCEAIYDAGEIKPERVAQSFLDWYNKGQITGVGAATLKALRELQVGGHWALVGRSGEYAAGNGAAMRIAPLAFKDRCRKMNIKDVCIITHKNDEAYVGALAVYNSILNIIQGNWKGKESLIQLIVPELPDTLVKDRLVELMELQDMSISEIGKIYVPTGYVVNSVPIALFAAQKINYLTFEEIITELIKIGGDTDTVCSIAGQIIGALGGTKILPEKWLEKYDKLHIKYTVDFLVNNWKFH